MRTLSTYILAFCLLALTATFGSAQSMPSHQENSEETTTINNTNGSKSSDCPCIENADKQEKGTKKKQKEAKKKETEEEVSSSLLFTTP